MTTEKNFWKQIKSNLPENCLTYRIESRTTKGIPDVHVLWDNLPFWLELKTTKHNGIQISPFQISFNTTYWNNGGFSFYLVKRFKDNGLFLFDGDKGSELSEFGVSGTSGFRASGFRDIWIKIKETIKNPTKKERKKNSRVNSNIKIF